MPGSPLYIRALRRHWNNRKCGAIKLRFPHAKEILRKLLAVLARALKNVCHPCPKPKKFKEVAFRGAKLSDCPGCAPSSGRPREEGRCVRGVMA